MEFAEFIQAHDGDDLAALALARSRFADSPECDVALSTLEVRRKLRSKVPAWYSVSSLRYPLRLSGEQCSSEETAHYKARVALDACQGGGALADLTGGLGVDSWAFAQCFGSVLYNEMRQELASAAEANFAALGLGNVRVSCKELRTDNLSAVLGDFKPDIIYLDPARRASDGRKVFRLEDCQPDVLKLLPELLGACPLLLLKLSPMADISLVCKQLGCVEAVHVVAADGECKELLLLLRRGHQGPCTITIYENGSTASVPGGRDVIPESVATLGRVRGRGPEPVPAGHGVMGGVAKRRFGNIIPSAGDWLFEPGKALLKAGAFDWPCGFGLEKLGRHTHLYIGAEIPEELKPFGKSFRILEVLPLDKRSIKAVATRYPQAAVTARNIPLTSDELRKKLGVKDGGTVHIFGAHADASQGNLLLICCGA